MPISDLFLLVNKEYVKTAVRCVQACSPNSPSIVHYKPSELHLSQEWGRPGVEVHALRADSDVCEFENSQGYTVKP